MRKMSRSQFRCGIAASQLLLWAITGYAGYRWPAHEFVRSIGLGVFCAQLTLLTLWLLLGEAAHRIATIPTIVVIIAAAKAIEACETELGVAPQYVDAEGIASLVGDALVVAAAVVFSVAIPFLAARLGNVVAKTAMRRDNEPDKHFTISIRQILVATVAVAVGAWAAERMRSARIGVGAWVDVRLMFLLASVSVTGIGSTWAVLSRHSPGLPACAVVFVTVLLLFCSDYATGAPASPLWFTLIIASVANFANVFGTLFALRRLGYRVTWGRK
jgi:hypothetical protein